jgi:DNA mismatch repair protein MutL
MPDIIKLLPDSVANQIAAGEVIQRPASVIKELVENAVDAGCSKIQVIVKDAGKTLIQVIDNGCGMSETDARMSFERHATSKISKAEQLFSILTKGFRGEALASIAAIAHVELKTKQTGKETGTKIIVEGSQTISQEATQCDVGSSFSVKNLFYNVPARRNFLKSDAVELKHIIEEFERVCLTHPEIAFTLQHNGVIMYNLPASNLKQRIVNYQGNNFNQKLVPLEEETNVVNIEGFVGKPEYAKRLRGEQYFFVNKRYIKSPYLHYAVSNAFDQLIAPGSHPSYFLYLNIDPASIDINIHPTKTEIKFRDEKTIYAILNAAVKRALGKNNIAPSIDFGESGIFIEPITSRTEIKQPTIEINHNYNPFNSENTNGNKATITFDRQTQAKNLNYDWQELYKISEKETKKQETIFDNESAVSNKQTIEEVIQTNAYQLHRKYILTQIKSGMVLIDQQLAHERILFEQFLEKVKLKKITSQQQLFPEHIELGLTNFQVFQEIKEDLAAVGFDIEIFGKNSIAVNGLPPEIANQNPKLLLDEIFEQFNSKAGNFKLSMHQMLAGTIARYAAIKRGKQLSIEEMNFMVDSLFACEQPYYSPSGKPTIITFTLEELDKKFEK